MVLILNNILLRIWSTHSHTTQQLLFPLLFSQIEKLHLQ